MNIGHVSILGSADTIWDRDGRPGRRQHGGGEFATVCPSTCVQFYTVVNVKISENIKIFFSGYHFWSGSGGGKFRSMLKIFFI